MSSFSLSLSLSLSSSLSLSLSLSLPLSPPSLSKQIQPPPISKLIMARSFSFLLAVMALLVVATSAELVNDNVARTIDLTSHLSTYTVDVTVKNTGAAMASSYVFHSDKELESHLSFLSAKVRRLFLHHQGSASSLFLDWTFCYFLLEVMLFLTGSCTASPELGVINLFFGSRFPLSVYSGTVPKP